MYENFGPKVVGNEVTFKLFFPDNNKDPEQYTEGGLPNIKKIQVTGDFQNKIGQNNWDTKNAPAMKEEDHPKGILYTYSITLPDNFYQYKFFVTFNDEAVSPRWCNDPCTKYSGQDPNNNENSGFVVGGNKVEDVKPIKNRLPQKDLIIYEVMIDDFTEKLINHSPTARLGLIQVKPKARLDLIRDNIKYLKYLGVNAVQFMPWTAVIGRDFNWGYEPFQFFSVDDRLTTIVNKTNDEKEKAKLDKLYRLKELIDALHDEGMHVIMDGVFNHAIVKEEGVGFPYYWLYQNPENSPYIQKEKNFFAGNFAFPDFNYDNECTNDFILDVCKYWLNQYQIDGIRLDYTRGLFDSNKKDKGLPKLIEDLRGYFEESNRQNISLMIEHLTDDRYKAINDTNDLDATGCWFEPFMHEVWKWAKDDTVDAKIMRSMDTQRDFDEDKAPVVYIENHDYGTLVNKVGGSQIGSHVRTDNWYKTQPCAIALLTLPGTILIHNGQEFGDEYFVPAHKHDREEDRVNPRPVNWDKLNDDIGKPLFGLYKKLIEIRKNHPSLRSPNFYPSDDDEENNTPFHKEGYGVYLDKKIIIYRRWEDGLNGQPKEDFVIVLNFSNTEQSTDIPFPSNGKWKDLLNNNQVYEVTEGRLSNEKINSNWGRILYRENSTK